LNNSIVSYALPPENLRSFDQSVILNSSINQPGSIEVNTMLSPRSLHKNTYLNNNEILTVGGASAKIIN